VEDRGARQFSPHLPRDIDKHQIRDPAIASDPKEVIIDPDG
jgi:hypothetical protein